jgi:hypothetical protein
MAIFGFVVLILIGIACMFYGVKWFGALPILAQLSPGAAWSLIAMIALAFVGAAGFLTLALVYAPFEVTWHLK